MNYTASPSLISRVIQAESGGNPNARSPVGAQGLMQIMPETARQPGFGLEPLKDPWNPEENKRFGTAYLSKLLERYGGDEEAALAGYNAGPGVADKWVAAGKDRSMLPEETRNYLSKIIGGGVAPATAMGAPQAAPTGGPAAIPTEALSPPSGRNTKLGEMLLASAAGAKPRGWGELLNAGGDLALGYSLSNKGDEAEKDYRTKLAQMISGASAEELPQALISSGDPSLMKAGVSARLAPPPKAPAAIQGYDMARQQGFQGSFLDYQKELKKAGASSVNVETKQEGEYEKTRGKALGEQFGKIMQDAQDATSRIGQLNSIDALLSNPDVYTGTGAQAINAVKRFGQSFLGMDVAGVADADAARRISAEMALSLKSDLPGPLSNSDREFLQELPPNIGDTAEGRKLLVELMKAKEYRKIEIARIAREYRAQNQGRLDDGFYDTLAQYNEANPLVTPEMMAQMRQNASQAPQPSPAAGVPTEFKQRWGLE